ncbi:flavodoxin family protein [Gordonibacter massiliensis (ex Traore et al. 2017)]|uniref:Flavodoxin family protein n=1 Tax=Gordonibacter massiliensis (ex Traore et al. 2017) TaxID=1841863 RepID=A0A842JEN8_9ACTN|nr:flavodoxin family protein [Gordonibacter massiliensis (ex Traore et al. 2017)]MBC2890147.1 flavodoxin family protein [Gordonibacter massiliensis (ex Traore et al. 2017)]
MARKIVVLNGSPRAKGNTAGLVEAFAQGARAAGAEVARFDLQKLDIHPCLGCFGGGKDEESPCVQKDGMGDIYPAYREADVVALASPLYYWSISGQLKCAFDRLFAVAECNEDYANPVKEAVLFMAAEGDGFEESEHWYDRLMGHLGWTDRGKVLAGGVVDVGDIAGHAELAEAEALGRTVARG